MKALALVTEEVGSDSVQWQFDKIMAAIAYDLDLTLVFVNNGLLQLEKNKAWKSLALFGVNQVYYIVENKQMIMKPLFDVKPLTGKQLKTLIDQTDFIL
jgi:sulfur relay (sulfurtransferase) DsrF/TusC family protein